MKKITTAISLCMAIFILYSSQQPKHLATEELSLNSLAFASTKDRLANVYLNAGSDEFSFKAKLKGVASSSEPLVVKIVGGDASTIIDGGDAAKAQKVKEVTVGDVVKIKLGSTVAPRTSIVVLISMKNKAGLGHSFTLYSAPSN